MFEGYHDVYDQSMRLSILVLRAEQNDMRLTDSMLEDLLVTRYLMNRGRGYLHNQLAFLAREAKVIAIDEHGPSTQVELLEAGMKHLAKRALVPGIKRPEGRLR